MVPGRALHRLAKVLLPSRVCDQIIDAQLADFQHEWAQPAGPLNRILVLTRGYLGFWRALTLCAVSSRGLDAGDRRSLIRGAGVAFGITVLAIAWWAVPQVLSLTTSARTSAHPVPVPLRLQIRILNSWITAMLPVAVAFGAAAGIATFRVETARRTRCLLLLGAFAGSICVAIAVGWILPLFNHAVNVAMGDCCSKWPMENTLGELRYGHDLLPSYYITIAAPWATVVTTMFALSIADTRWLVRVAFTIVVCWLYQLLMFPPRWPALYGSMPLALEAWVANLTVIALTMGAFALTRMRSMRSTVLTA